MFETWVWLGFFGGAFQAFRIAGQRMISVATEANQSEPSVWVSPLSRVILGVPVSAMILIFTLQQSGVESDVWAHGLNLSFWLWISAAAFLQLMGTILQTSLVKRRNFAVGIIYLKIMVPAQAVLGVMLFQDRFTALQWIALILVTAGVFVLGKARTGAGLQQQGKFDWISLVMGLTAGVLLALTGLFIMEANFAITADGLNPVALGMSSLLALTTIQLFTCMGAIMLRDASEFRVLADRYRVVLFTGLMSVGASSCWFIGFVYASPALVNAVGQSEFLFAMFLSLYLFSERPTPGELLGTVVVLVGIVILLVGG